jgi:hypothetical protein
VGTRQNRASGRCVVRRETQAGEHGTYEVTETPATATTMMCESANLKLSPVGDLVGVSQLSHTTDTVKFETSEQPRNALIVSYCPLGSPLVLRSGYEWRGCPQAVSRESHRTRNKNKQTSKGRRVVCERERPLDGAALSGDAAACLKWRALWRESHFTDFLLALTH